MNKNSLKSTIIALALFATILLGTSSQAIANQPKMKTALGALIVAERQLKKAHMTNLDTD